MRAREFIVKIPITLNLDDLQPEQMPGPAQVGAEPEMVQAEPEMTPEPVSQPELATGVKPVDAGPVDAETDMMVGPLQQQLELLKRAAGVASVFDETDAPKQQKPTTDSERARLQVAMQAGQSPAG
jgi:hypothetical protein